MTTAAAVCFGATLLFALVDWFAVARELQSVEYVAKPLTLVALVGAAVVLDPVDSASRTWFVVALVFCLAGDVFLMLPRNLFVAGLASFLVGHLAYIVGMRMLDASALGFGLGIGFVVVAVPVVGGRVVRAVRSGPEPELLVPVMAYIAVISAMVVAATTTGVALLAVGALLFYASDALIAWTRFIADLRWGRVAVIVTYHLAQVALVAALTTA